jgi:uncharacterized protein YjiS (DUF1127 family)
VKSNKQKGGFAMVLSGLVKRGWATIKIWREISKERSELRRLSEHLAKDIGISRAEAEREADRPFWDYDADTKSLHGDRGDPVGRVGADRKSCCLQS